MMTKDQEFLKGFVNIRAIKYSGFFLKKGHLNFSMYKNKTTTLGLGGLHAIQQYACVKHQSITLYKSLKLFSLLSYSVRDVFSNAWLDVCVL